MLTLKHFIAIALAALLVASGVAQAGKMEKTVAHADKLDKAAAHVDKSGKAPAAHVEKTQEPSGLGDAFYLRVVKQSQSQTAEQQSTSQDEADNYVQLIVDEEKQLGMLSASTTSLAQAARFHFAQTPADSLIVEVVDAAGQNATHKIGVVYPLRTPTRDIYFVSAKQRSVGGPVKDGPPGFRAPLTLLACSLSDAVGFEGKVLKCKDERGFGDWQDCEGKTIAIGEPHAEQGEAMEDTNSEAGTKNEAGNKGETQKKSEADTTSETQGTESKTDKRSESNKEATKTCEILTLRAEPVKADEAASSGGKHKAVKRWLL